MQYSTVLFDFDSTTSADIVRCAPACRIRMYVNITVLAAKEVPWSTPLQPSQLMGTTSAGTLYPNENGYEAHTRQNIYEFMHQRLGVPRDECKEVHAKLFAQTNQTLKALRDVGGYQFDQEECAPQPVDAPFVCAALSLNGHVQQGSQVSTACLPAQARQQCARQARMLPRACALMLLKDRHTF